MKPQMTAMSTFEKCHARADRFRTIRSASSAWKPGTLSMRQEKAQVPTGELYLYQMIGADWFGEGITADSVRQALDGLKGVKQLNMYINCEGGDVFEAKAIYTQLKRFDAKKTAYIDGIAASAATFVMLAADEVAIAPEANLMIHEAWGIAAGPASDLRDYADLLDIQNKDIASIYSKKTGGTAEEMRALMAAETWMNASKALELKFVDRIASSDDDEDEEDGEDMKDSKKMTRASALLAATKRVLTGPAASDPAVLEFRQRRIAAQLNIKTPQPQQEKKQTRASSVK